MDNAGTRRERIQLSGHAVIEACAQRNDQIRALESSHRGNSAVHAGHLQVVRVRIGEGTASGKSRHDSRVGQCDQFAQFLFGARSDEAAADVEHGSLRACDLLCSALDLARNGLECGLIAGKIHGRRPDVFELFDLCGSGDIHQDGTRAASFGDVEGFGETSGDFTRVRDQERVLGKGH